MPDPLSGRGQAAGPARTPVTDGRLFSCLGPRIRPPDKVQPEIQQEVGAVLHNVVEAEQMIRDIHEWVQMLVKILLQRDIVGSGKAIPSTVNPSELVPDPSAVPSGVSLGQEASEIIGKTPRAVGELRSSVTDLHSQGVRLENAIASLQERMNNSFTEGVEESRKVLQCQLEEYHKQLQQLPPKLESDLPNKDQVQTDVIRTLLQEQFEVYHKSLQNVPEYSYTEQIEAKKNAPGQEDANVSDLELEAKEGSEESKGGIFVEQPEDEPILFKVVQTVKADMDRSVAQHRHWPVEFHADHWHWAAVALNKEQVFFRRVVDNPMFEGFFVLLVLLNTFIAALESQVQGFDIGFQLGVSGDGKTTWPNADKVFNTLEYVFAVLYTIELSIKLLGLHCKFFKDAWNLFDFFLVGFWYVTQFTSIGSGVNPIILRLVRLMRLMRLVRHLGWFEAFDSLHMLISAIKASFSVLVWSTMILMALLCVSSLGMNGMLSDFMQDPSEDLKSRSEVYSYFGTFTRSMISMFEISFASHAPIMRIIMNEVGEGYALFFVVYKCIVGLSVMKVITGVFMHETFKVCSTDDELMVIQHKRAVLEQTRKMEKLFKKADSSQDGKLSWQEFQKIMVDPWLVHWLSAQELDTHHIERLWELMDEDHNYHITPQELVMGVDMLRGTAKSIDMNHAIHCIDELLLRQRAMSSAMHAAVP